MAQVTNLRRHCFDKQVEMKVAKNTLIKKALESLDNEKYSGVYDSLHQVTALMFSESPKEPALIISSFRKSLNGEKPVLKAAFLNGDIFVGDNQLVNLTKIKTKNELIGEVIGLLMSPIQRVIGALQNRPETPIIPEHKAEGTERTKAEPAEPKAATPEVKSETKKVAEVKGTEPVADKVKQAGAKAEAKVEVAEPKAVAPEVKSETKKAAEVKGPGLVADKVKQGEAKPEAKIEVAEPKAVAPEVKSETKKAAEVKGTEPVADTVKQGEAKPEAKIEVAEPKAVATEVKSETPW